MQQKRVKDNDIAAVCVFILLLCMFLSTIITKRAEKNKTVDYKSEALKRTIAKGGKLRGKKGMAWKEFYSALSTIISVTRMITGFRHCGDMEIE